MKRHTALSLLAGLILAAATNVSAWWGGGWNPYDPWDPRYWMEEFFGGGWGYGGPWGGYGYPYYGGYGYGPWGGYGYPYYAGYGYGGPWGGHGYPYYRGYAYGWPYYGGYGYAPALAAPAKSKSETKAKS
jgi:hypothetical protein